jgi:hypothetical protein
MTDDRVILRRKRFQEIKSAALAELERELYFAAIGELNITPDEWSATFKYILRANRKAHRWASGTAHC